MDPKKLRRLIGIILLIIGVGVLALGLAFVITDADIATNTNLNIFLYSSIVINTVAVMLIRSGKKDKGGK